MNIILVGFMGVGKTSVGRILAKDMNFHFIDLDEYIENHYRMTVREIFEQCGEEQFREFEKKAVKEIVKSKKTIFSTGGGTFIDEENMKQIKGMGTVIYLKASLRKVKDNLRNQYRPLLANKNDNELINLYEKRIPLYESADYMIDTEKINVFEVVEEIKSILNG